MASGASRRQRKALKTNMELLLNLDVSGKKDWNKLSAMGVEPKDIDNAMLLAAALFREAATGNVAAFREIRDLVGELGQGQEEEGTSGVVNIPAVMEAPAPPEMAEGGGDGG